MSEKLPLNYPGNEHQLKQSIDNNLQELKAHIIKHGKLEKRYTANDMLKDGFFPYYTEQKPKILFIGREAYGNHGDDYIKSIYNKIKTDGRIGKKTLNQYTYFARMFYVTYGIKNSIENYQEIPYAKEMIPGFATQNGISFALMNLSKLSNDEDSTDACWPLIDSFLNSLECTNFIQNQISLLDPDIIITMNLKDRKGKLGNIEENKCNDSVTICDLKINGKSYFLLDTYHFSSTGTDDINQIYKPIYKAVKEHMS